MLFLKSLKGTPFYKALKPFTRDKNLYERLRGMRCSPSFGQVEGPDKKYWPKGRQSQARAPIQGEARPLQA